MTFLKEENVRDCFIQSAVVFPDSIFDYSGLAFDNFWHLNSELSFYEFIGKCFDDNRGVFSDRELTDDQLNDLIELINPTLTPNSAHIRIRENLRNI